MPSSGVNGQRFANLIGRHQQPLAVDQAGGVEVALLRVRPVTKKLSAAYPSVEFRRQRRQLAEQVQARWQWCGIFLRTRAKTAAPCFSNSSQKASM
jgi:hypothetical protein